MKEHNYYYQDEEVKHVANCHSVSCLLDDKHKHFTTYSFETIDSTYIARSLDEAATMWIDSGRKPLVNVGRCG